MKRCEYFAIQELVSPLTYNKFGESAWMFFDDNILGDLDTIRKEWGSPIIINNWAYGGQYKESGLRCNVDSIVVDKTMPYLSGHVLAKGFDLKPKSKCCDKFSAFLWVLLSSGKLKSFKRMENPKSTTTWSHIDALRTSSGKAEVFYI